MKRIVVCAALAAFVVACDSPVVMGTQISVPTAPTAPTSPTLPTLGGKVLFAGSVADLFVGDLRRLQLTAYDPSGAPTSTDQALVTTSDESVAIVSAASVIPIEDSYGRTWKDLSSVLRFVGPGEVTVSALLNNTVSSVALRVPAVLGSTSLVVESFMVIEYRACASECPYLIYAPLIKLREPTGTSSVTVVSVEFTMGDRTTGICHGSMLYTPGLSAHLNGIADYLWSNDMIFVSIDGRPLPGDAANARVIVRESNGSYGEIKATGPVQRMVANPSLPAPTSDWDCVTA